MKHVAVLLLAVVLSASYALCADAGRVTFYVNDPIGRNVVRFESKAPLEAIWGTSNRIGGTIQIDPEDIQASPQVSFEVDLTSLDTGIDLRNRHMRGRYLQVDQYPKVRFALDRIEKTSQKGLVDGEAVDIQGIGTLHLHGLVRQEAVRVRITYLKESEKTRQRMRGNLMRVEAEFELKLTDYEIPIPQLVALRLDETIRIVLDVFATDAPPGSGPGEDK